MTPAAILPWVSAVLQDRYLDQRRTYIARQEGLVPWPKRRSRKRTRQVPGLYELAADEFDG